MLGIRHHASCMCEPATHLHTQMGTHQTYAWPPPSPDCTAGLVGFGPPSFWPSSWPLLLLSSGENLLAESGVAELLGSSFLGSDLLAH